MDFLAKEIFYLFWFSSMLGTFGAITKPTPLNQAVLDGTADVKITCVSNTNANAIKWSFMPAGSKDKKPINIVFTDNADYSGLADADGKSYTLTIKTASASTAGSYTCDEGGIYTVQLIVLKGEASCDYSPRDTTKLSCESTLTLSCAVKYITNTTLLTADMAWSTDPETEGLVSPDTLLSPPDSGNIATSTSTLDVTWPKDGNIPIYTCAVTFRLFQSVVPKNRLASMAKSQPLDLHQCQPFASASIVPCGGKDPGDDTKKSEIGGNSSVRSAETNNLAILVLGVAGVLLLAQVI